MNGLFSTLLSMSLSASWLILAVLLLRQILKKAPKWIRVLLWGMVAVRLLCPLTPESRFSLLPGSVGSGELVSEWKTGYLEDIQILREGSEHYENAVAAGRDLMGEILD